VNWLVPLDIGLVMGLLFAWAVIALALGFRLLNFPDLTVEGSVPLGAALFAAFSRAGLPLTGSILAAIVGGMLAGSLTGFLHVRFRMNKFLAGIIVIAMAYSISLRIMDASNIGLLNQSTVFDLVKPLDGVGTGVFHSGTILILLVFLAIGSVAILAGLSSRRGLRLRVAGSNPEYAHSLGISVPRNIVAGLAITNGLAAFSGVLLAMHQGFSDVGMGQGVLILALAAMTIGERLLPEKRFPFHVFVLVSAILGSIAYQVLVAYAVRAGLAPSDLKLATAVLVLLVVALRISRNGELFTEMGA